MLDTSIGVIGVTIFSWIVTSLLNYFDPKQVQKQSVLEKEQRTEPEKRFDISVGNLIPVVFNGIETSVYVKDLTWSMENSYYGQSIELDVRLMQTGEITNA